LFRLADDSEEQIHSYLNRGDVLFATESGQALGHVLIVELDAKNVFELMSIAVLAARQGQGIGGMLIRAAIRYCLMRNATSLRVSTSIADAGAIGFYLRHGFRASAIVRDAFTLERGYPANIDGSSIPLNDAVEFELVLDTAAATI
jgi:GNAT superfamily N-acetyltransferase